MVAMQLADSVLAASIAHQFNADRTDRLAVARQIGRRRP